MAWAVDAGVGWVVSPLRGVQKGTCGMPVLREGLLVLIVSSCDSTTVLSTGKTPAARKHVITLQMLIPCTHALLKTCMKLRRLRTLPGFCV